MFVARKTVAAFEAFPSAPYAFSVRHCSGFKHFVVKASAVRTAHKHPCIYSVISAIFALYNTIFVHARCFWVKDAEIRHKTHFFLPVSTLTAILERIEKVVRFKKGCGNKDREQNKEFFRGIFPGARFPRQFRLRPYRKKNRNKG